MSTLKQLKSESYDHIRSIGGYLNLQESDNYNNGLNRKQIEAFKDEFGAAYLGKVNYYDNERQGVIKGTVPVLTEYKGETVFTFSCSFCVPCRDEQLEDSIRRWNKSSSSATIDEIFDRVEELGGILLIWT